MRIKQDNPNNSSKHDGSASRPKRRLWINLGVSIVILGGLAAGIIFLSKDNDESDAVAESITQAEADSLRRVREAERLEALRRDSIARDSLIKDSIRRNFISPDLRFHDLKGAVKRCEISTTREIAYMEHPVLEFNTEGVWVNDGWKEDRRIVRHEYPKDLDTKVTRNKEGYISRQKYLGDFEEMCAEEYIWRDGKITEIRNCSDPSLRTHYKYDGDRVAETHKRDASEAFKKIEITQKYVYTDFDEVGNWTRRKVKESIKGQEWGSSKPYKENNNYYEIRKITYY